MESDPDRRRKQAFAAGGVLALIGIAWVVWSNLPPPQLKLTDKQVFNTVDALFTALTSRDLARLTDCEQRLKTYHSEGRTSNAVASTLDAIVKQARAGEWEPAAKKLYEFMIGQRGTKTGTG